MNDSPFIFITPGLEKSFGPDFQPITHIGPLWYVMLQVPGSHEFKMGLIKRYSPYTSDKEAIIAAGDIGLERFTTKGGGDLILVKDFRAMYSEYSLAYGYANPQHLKDFSKRVWPTLECSVQGNLHQSKLSWFQKIMRSFAKRFRVKSLIYRYAH